MEIPTVKMSHTVNTIFVLIFALMGVLQAQNCNLGICENVCAPHNMDGICEGDECYCFDFKRCAEMNETTCDRVCDELDLVAECDGNDFCMCKAAIHPCPAIECEEQCQKDPKTQECKNIGGFVRATACSRYGPAQTCVCPCNLAREAKDREKLKALFNPETHP